LITEIMNFIFVKRHSTVNSAFVNSKPKTTAAANKTGL
jgi:hypothetical protein